MVRRGNLVVRRATCHPYGVQRYTLNAGWSSPVARWAHNPKVAGSNPAPATNIAQNANQLTPPNSDREAEWGFLLRVCKFLSFQGYRSLCHSDHLAVGLTLGLRHHSLHVHCG